MSRVRYCVRLLITAVVGISLLSGCTSADSASTIPYGNIQGKDRAKILQEVYGKIPIPNEVYGR